VSQRFNPYKLFTGSFIPNCLMRYKDLSPSAKLCWARLAQYAGENGIAYPSLDTLAYETGITTRAVIKAIKELVNKGFLEVEKPTGIDKLLHKTNRYYFILHDIFRSELKDISESELPHEQNAISEGEQNDTSVYEQNDTSAYEQNDTQRDSYLKDSIKENIYSKVAKEEIPYEEIINDLNEKADKHYRVTEATKKLIKARWQEGFRLEDFKRVHSNMCLRWKNDEKMNQYLRPSTLYRPSKFESYLNMPPLKKKGEWALEVLQRARVENGHLVIEPDEAKKKAIKDIEEFFEKARQAQKGGNYA